jgi:Ca2+/H+ antiporter
MFIAFLTVIIVLICVYGIAIWADKKTAPQKIEQDHKNDQFNNNEATKKITVENTADQPLAPKMIMKKELWIPQAIGTAISLWCISQIAKWSFVEEEKLFLLVLCVCFAYTAVQAFKQKNINWAWVLGFMAAVHNPLLPLDMGNHLANAFYMISIGVLAGSVSVLHGIPLTKWFK